MPQIIKKLAEILSEKNNEIEEWFSEQYAHTNPFFYSSVDLRHSGHKLVPVDTNLFPAGFNLLSDSAKENCILEMKNYFSNMSSPPKKLLIIPENHTRNLYYLENVAILKELIEKANLEVELGSLGLEEESLEVESQSGKKLTIYRIDKKGSKVSVNNNFEPDVILVNNDLSGGAPDILRDLEQEVIPPVGLGWYQRRKTRHFDTYSEVANKFATKFGIDEWLISTIFSKCGTVNFKEKTGLECVAVNIEKTLFKIKKKYNDYGIEDEPYVFIKADSGTYGMGIMTAKSPEEFLNINKDLRKKMNVIKEGVSNTEVIIQEGVPTIDKIDGKPAEPLMYLINGKTIGCTYRINEERDEFSNLNSRGMTFDSVCENDEETSGKENNLCPVRGLIARLASLAATRECYEPKWEI